MLPQDMALIPIASDAEETSSDESSSDDSNSSSEGESPCGAKANKIKYLHLNQYKHHKQQMVIKEVT